jgi:hypothetical protein
VTVSYDPYPTVTINGSTTIADNTLSSIQINMGRQDVLEQAGPGFANISFWTDGNSPLDIELSDKIEIEIAKGTSGSQTIFTGIISDIVVTFDAYGADGSIARYSVTAVGPLAQLNKRLSAATYAEERDGTRVFNILSDAFTTTWADLVGLTSWTNAPDGISWAQYDAEAAALVATFPTDIDTPGQYILVAYAGGESNALSLAQDAANSGRGVLWEAANGSIYYDDYAARALASPYALTADDVLAAGLMVDAKWGEIYNYVDVVYATGTASDENVLSQQLYGTLVGSKTTTLKNATDALAQAQDYVKSRAFARVYPSAITVPLHSPTVSDATRDQMAAVYNGLYITCDDLPPVMGGELKAFVEGWQWSLTRYTAELTLFLSAYSETYSREVWLQVPQTTTWATYDNSVIWENAA